MVSRVSIKLDGMQNDIWCRLQDSNPLPDDYKSTALPDELNRLDKIQGMQGVNIKKISIL